MDATTLNSESKPFSVKLWPPSQNTRSMLVERMTKNLSSPSIFTQKYGSLSKEEAAENGKRIENKAFVTANHYYEKEPDGDGGSAVQKYAKECSMLLLEVLKKGSKIKNDGVLSTDYGHLQTDDQELPTVEKVKVPYETLFDISTGQRAFIEEDEAKELLKPLTEPGNFYTKICFSNRSFGLNAARVAEPILTALKDQLKEVDLSDFIAGRPEAEALEVMHIFSSALEGCVLRSLNLSNNALGEKGVRAFGALLKSLSNLEELYLMNDGISEEAAQAVAELIPSTENLKVLHFHNNMTGDEGAFAISEIVRRSPLLEDFRCSSTRVDSEGGVALAKALEKCPNLKKLDLRDNMFGVEAGITLSKSLSTLNDLTEIYLSYLNLEDEGAVTIVNAIRESLTSLEVLEMAGNDITASSAPDLAACLANKNNLTKLNLSENELKDEGAILIGKCLEEVQVQELDMSSNCFGIAGARVLARAVVEKPGFKLLNINGNFISDEGVDEVNAIFKRSPDLLGSLDENDPDGGDDDDHRESNEKGDNNDEELESKLKNLQVNEED